MTGMITPFSGQSGVTAKLSLLQPLDPEKAKKAEETKQVLQQTLAAMKNSKNKLGQDKKAMAAQKIARIKESLKNLKMMQFTDPKAMAKMAARLAKELASAVKEYASAGATFTEVQSSGGGATPPAASGEAAQGNATPDAVAQADAQTTEAHLAENPVTVPVPTGETATGEKAVKDEANKAVNAYEKTQHLKNDEDGNKTIRKKDDDSEFIKEAKKIMDELREMIKSLRQKVGKKPLFKNDEVGEAEKALKEAEREFAAMTRALSAGGGDLGATATPATTA